jgi:hypothetical protein
VRFRRALPILSPRPVSQIPFKTNAARQDFVRKKNQQTQSDDEATCNKYIATRICILSRKKGS